MVKAGAQIPGADTVFGPADLHYFSGFEKETFAAYFKDNPDYLSMAVAVDMAADENQAESIGKIIEETVLRIRDRKFDNLSEEKKIERIENHVSKTFLVSYDYRAGFGDLFRYGKYNYQTAAAIYSFIFDRVGIPYEIRERPAYIYMIAYPEDRRIMLEIAPPDLQTFMLGYETRNNFVEFMHSTGVIDEQTFKNTSARNLFETHYFAGYGFNLKEIVGMLYLNSALLCIEQDDPRNAYSQFEKAFLLYPSYKTQYLLIAQLYAFLQHMDYHKTGDLEYLVKAAGLIGYGIEPELISAYLVDIIHTILAEEGDEETILRIREYLGRHLPGARASEFEFHYLYEYGRQNFLEADYSAALDCLEAAFRVFPEDENNQNLLVAALAGYAGIASPALVLDRIEEYDTAYTELESEDVLTYVKAKTFLEVFGESFELQNRESGEKYMRLFEDLIDRNPYLDIDPNLLGRSYSSAAIYYYRSGMIGRSREVLLKGLGYAPENTDLKLKLNSIE